jgi:hypothetical protein
MIEIRSIEIDEAVVLWGACGLVRAPSQHTGEGIALLRHGKKCMKKFSNSKDDRRGECPRFRSDIKVF